MNRAKAMQVEEIDTFLNIVNREAAKRPQKVGYIIGEAAYRRLEHYDREEQIRQEQAHLEGWKNSLLRIAGGAGRAATCLIWLGGAADDLMNPTFAMLLTGISVVWGAGYVLRGWRNA